MFLYEAKSLSYFPLILIQNLQLILYGINNKFSLSTYNRINSKWTRWYFLFIIVLFQDN